MEAIVSLCAIIALSMLALRLGTREPRTLLASGWSTRYATPQAARNRPNQGFPLSPDLSHLPHAGATESVVNQNPWAPPTARTYPLLRFIDAACEPGHVPFALDRDAEVLENRAKEWADSHWGETAWITGYLRQDRLDAIRAELECARRARSGIVHPPSAPAFAKLMM